MCIDELIATARINGRVCPLPNKWNHFWHLLPDKRQVGSGWQPSLPLILGAWHEASNLQKKQRFESHLRWAYEHGAENMAINFVLDLSEDDWFCEH